MASAALESDVRQLLVSSGTFGPREIEQLIEAIDADLANHKVLRDAVQELEQQEHPSPATKVRIGVGCFLLGRYTLASDYLGRADGSALAQFYLAKAHTALGKYQPAIEAFQAAAKAGYDSAQCVLGQVEVLRLKGDAKGALAKLDSLPAAAHESAEYLYQRASTLATLKHDPLEYVPMYEKAVALNPRHPGALFGLALENDRHGNDHLALEMYERSANRFPTNLGTLLNLGLLYEDRQEYGRASGCYERILSIFPEHPRAKLFFKDSQASRDMYYDEDERRRSDRMSQILAIPVTDFELSVRSRNCLQKMGVRTLGDLTQTTEQELLASKNFGETSLNEIKEMLTSRGLRLGQSADVKRPAEADFDPGSMSPDEQALLTKPVADLNLSVRARKCMIRLGLNTIGELVRHTGDELLECKNFGVTSLNEVREKLTAYGLKLRGE
jgi:DNA-directed RNA polymerase subunit alpha